MPTENVTMPRLSPEEAGDLARERYGIVADFEPLPSYVDQNFRLRSADGDGWVLKIANAAAEGPFLEAQVAALEHLGKRLPAGMVPAVRRTLSGDGLFAVERSGQRHLVYLVSYLPGTLLARFHPCGRDLLESLGRLVATVDDGLADFCHPATRREDPWDVRFAPRVLAFTETIVPARRRILVERCLAEIEEGVLPHLDELPAGVIHNDGNDHNVLVAGGGDPPRAAAMLDFGNMTASRRVFGLAVAAAYAHHGADDPLGVIAAVTAGYHRVRPLSERELEVLLPAVRARIATSVTMTACLKQERPEDAYLTVSEEPGWTALEQLAGVGAGTARRRFADACGIAAGTSRADSGRSPKELLEVRRRHLGPSLSVSYRKPLKIVRGYMQYLFDHHGRAYLDGVNNVCHVGHCHPRVVAAVARQMERLNTNTRYLHDRLAEYAERLVATLPEPLSVCYFVCTGSEANDLALRLARAHTGRRGAIVVEGAYHGHTGCLIELSPYKYDGPGGPGRPDHVRAVMMPDGFRRLHKRSDPEAGRNYAEHVAEAVADLERSPHGVGAFFCESLLGCGGQVVPPPGYLEHAFRHVRRAGGVCVADEVQVGFGRAGSHFWAFEAQGAVPDVVTLGKPIGNGHPLAAVVTTPEIAASFANGMEYFNTFGGNPVSCAAGLAVLEVIEEEGLQAHAGDVGRRLLTDLEELSARHSLIGDVRGLGLFLGVELVREGIAADGGPEPAAAEATRVIEGLKERGILLSTDGPLHNVLKIKPPLPFSQTDAERLVAALDEELASLR